MTQFDLFGEVQQKLDARAQQREAEAAKPKPTPSRRRRYAVPRDPNQHANEIAENVMGAWFSHHGGSRMDIPLGSVAALCFFREPLVADWLLPLKPEQLPQLFKEIWGVQWFSRPDLIEVARPLHDWLEEEQDTYQLRSVQAVVHAAVNTGLMDITAETDPYLRSQADVLSPLLTHLRHKSDKKWRGEYHTPPCVTDLLAHMLVDSDIKPGASFREPAIGSGGMFRSVAQRLRELNLNPHDFRWFGNDIDHLSTACAAVNAILWDLGPQTAIWRADTLADHDNALVTKALAERKAVIEHRNRIVEEARMRATIHHLDRLLQGAAA